MEVGTDTIQARKSADKISIGLGEYNDALYEIGTNVKITLHYFLKLDKKITDK